MRAVTLLLLAYLAVLSRGSDTVPDVISLDEVSSPVGTSEESGKDVTDSSNVTKNGDSAACVDSPDTSTETGGVDGGLISEPSKIESNATESEEEQDTNVTESGKDQEETASKKTDEKGSTEDQKPAVDAPVQSGPFIDLLGETLLSLEMIDEGHAQLHTHYTNEALSGKKVVGLYFSADWCGPCRQFTPDLVNFYKKMNSRRGKENDFEIVWISRCRDFDSFGQYFTQMNWLAVQPEDAMGQRGQMLTEKYKVKGIPTLVLLDEVGNVITTDARNKIPQDKAGIGFPWRNPIATLYVTIVPKSLRLMVKSHINLLKGNILKTVKGALGLKVTT